MFKVITLLAFISVCIAAKVPLRDPGYWYFDNSFEALNDLMGWDIGYGQVKEDADLQQLAQSVADLEVSPHDFISSYKKPDDVTLLVYGTKLKGNATLKQILNEDFNVVLEGMTSFVNYRYRNNSLRVDAEDLKAFMDFTQCDTVNMPGSCNLKRCLSLWRSAIGNVKFHNEHFDLGLKIKNPLKFMQNIFNDQKDMYGNTHHTEIFKNDLYELNVDVPDVFGSKVWTHGESDVKQQLATVLATGGNVHAVADFQHAYAKFRFEMNELITAAQSPDQIGVNYKVLYEMFDRNVNWKNFNKIGFGYSLDSNGDINNVIVVTGPIKESTKFLDKTERTNLVNGFRNWPYLLAQPTRRLSNPMTKKEMIDMNMILMDLTIGPINEDRKQSGLPTLSTKNEKLNALAQAAADKMAVGGQFTQPDFSTVSNSKVMIMAMRLDGKTTLKEYSFIINDNNFGQVTCYDNFSNLKHRVANLIDNERYICSKNSKIKVMIEQWKKYTTWGTGFAFNEHGDNFLTIALSDIGGQSEL